MFATSFTTSGRYGGDNGGAGGWKTGESMLSAITGTFVLVSNVRICAVVLVSEQREATSGLESLSLRPHTLVSEQREATTGGLAVGTQKLHRSYQHY
jgi:hypothetical protein